MSGYPIGQFKFDYHDPVTNDNGIDWKSFWHEFVIEIRNFWGKEFDLFHLYGLREEIAYHEALKNKLEVCHIKYARWDCHKSPANGRNGGRFCSAADSGGWDVTGIDVSKSAISIAMKFAKFPVYVITVEELVASQRKYDIVTAFDVLEHLKDPGGFLASIRKLLPSKGQIFCTVPNWECASVRLTDNPFWLPPVHVHFFTCKSLSRLAIESGFYDMTTKVIWTDQMPRGAVSKLKWMRRRIFRRENISFGLALHVRI